MSKSKSGKGKGSLEKGSVQASAKASASAPDLAARGLVTRLWAMRPLRPAVIAIGSLALAYGLLTGSALLPADRINGQIAHDVDVLVAETNYPTQKFLGSQYVRDNYTDALMLNMSMIDSRDPLASTFAARYYDDPSIGPVASLAFRVEPGGDAALNNGYIRYWQGYVSVLRPLFLVLTYSAWRTVNALLLLALMVACAVQIGRRIGWGSAAVFAAALAAAAPAVIFNSLQFSGVFYLALSGVLAVIYLADRYPYHRWDLELFVGLGIATAFFDFLTAPIITLGLPLAVLLARRLAWGNADREGEASDGGGAWMPALRALPAWGVGYVGFWAVRWVTNAMFINPDALTDIAGAIAQRSGTDPSSAVSLADRFTVVGLNFSQLLPHTSMPTDQVTFLAMADGGKTSLFLIVLLVLILWAVGGAVSGAARWSLVRSWPLLVVAALPIGWALFAANHSLNHYFFTFRIMLLVVFGLGLLLVHGVYWDGVRDRLGLGAKGRR